jgi:hypothetical protein
MRRIVITSVFAGLTILLPSVMLAQRGGPPFDGPRGVLTFQLSDGEPVSFYLEWSRELELSEPQKKELIEIRRKLRAQNASFVRQLDSLRQYAGIDMTERTRLTEADREAFRRFEKWSAPIVDSIRINNEGARREIKVVLAVPQLARADSIAAAMRDPRGRRPGAQRAEIPRGTTPNELTQPDW